MTKLLRCAAMLAALGGMLLSTGCDLTRHIVGSRTEYLFHAYDAIGRPGEQVDLRVRLQKGTFLRDQEDVTVRFTLPDGRTFEARTDEEGYASASFTPPRTGDYYFNVTADAQTEDGQRPAPRELLVACRPADAPIIVIDLDKTLVASGFHHVLAGDPVPMPESEAVMRELARNHTIVYLTQRPDYFGPKSLTWLNRHGYPRGALLMTDNGSILQGNRRFKDGEINELSTRFTAIQAGVGDKTSDMKAYLNNGLRAIYILHLEDATDPEEILEDADDLDGLPEGTEVVLHWRQVRKALLEGEKYPVADMKSYLKEMAADLQAEQ